jgi:hypothetical protein
MDVKGMKVRHDAWPVLMVVAEVGYDVKLIPPGQDGWHSANSVATWIAAQLKADDARRGAIPDDAPLVGGMGPVATAAEAMAGKGYYLGDSTMSPETAYATGRITAKSRPDWEQRYAANPDDTGAALASLAPVWDNTTNSSIPGPLTAEEELDMIDDALFGPGHSEMSRKRMRSQENEQALTDYRAIEQAEREAAGQTISADEWRQIYGTEPPEGIM